MRRPTSAYRRCLWIAATLALGGCLEYQAEPVDPAKNLAAFEARRLTSADAMELATATAPASATPAPSTTSAPADMPWNLERLARLAAAWHPDIAVAYAHIRATRAGEITAGEMPNPSLAFSPTYATKAPGVSPWTIGWTFDIPIETAGKRELRLAEARAMTDVARTEYAQAVWQVRSHLRDALADYLLTEREVALRGEEVASRTRYLEGLEARLKAGEAARPDVDTAHIDLLSAQQDQRVSEGQLRDARSKLATAIGMPVKGLENTTFTWQGIDRFEAISDDLRTRLQTAGMLDRLDLHHSLLEYAAADADVRLQLARQYPDVHLGPAYEFDQGQNKWTLGASVELPILNQNGGAIAEAYGKRHEDAAKVLAVQAQALGELESAIARYEAALHELSGADESLAAVSAQVNEAQKALNAGQEDRLTVMGLEVQRQVAERLRWDSVRKAREAAGALEDAIERPLDDLPPAGTAPATMPSAPSPQGATGT